MVIVEHDIDGLGFYNICGEIKIRSHNESTIKIISNREDSLIVVEKEGVLCISYSKEETETTRKTFIEKIFKKSFKLTLPSNSSFVEDKDTISIYHLLNTDI